VHSNLQSASALDLETRGRRRNGSRRRDNKRSERGNRSASRLGEPRIHLSHFSQRSSPLRLPRPIRYTRISFSHSAERPIPVSFYLSMKQHHHFVLHIIGYPWVLEHTESRRKHLKVWIFILPRWHLMRVFSEATTKSKLASLNEKLDVLERRLELLEVQVGNASANPSLFATWFLCCKHSPPIM